MDADRNASSGLDRLEDPVPPSIRNSTHPTHSMRVNAACINVRLASCLRINNMCSSHRRLLEFNKNKCVRVRDDMLDICLVASGR